MTCPKCGGSGLLPFKENGRIIKNAWVDCPCKDTDAMRDRYTAVTPSDFDFPMSDTFRAYSFEYCNQQDPAHRPVTEREVIREVIPERVVIKHHYIGPQQEVKHKATGKPSGYKGIR